MFFWVDFMVFEPKDSNFRRKNLDYNECLYQIETWQYYFTVQYRNSKSRKPRECTFIKNRKKVEKRGWEMEKKGEIGRNVSYFQILEDIWAGNFFLLPPYWIFHPMNKWHIKKYFKFHAYNIRALLLFYPLEKFSMCACKKMQRMIDKTTKKKYIWPSRDT